MKRSVPAAMAALMLAGCADADPVGLSPDAAAVSSDAPVSAHHIWQAGNGSAYHGYTAPDVDYDGNSGMLCATWSDAALADGFASADHFSFDFGYFDETGGEWVDLGDVNANESAGDRTACYDLSGWEDGSYQFEVTGTAKDGKGGETTTHHTDAWTGDVVIGAAWWIDVTGGNAQDLEQNANSANFTLEYQLYRGTTLITDCDTRPDVTWAADVKQDCDAEEETRTLVLANPDHKSAGTWTLEFHWGDPENPFEGVEISSILNGSGKDK